MQPAAQPGRHPLAPCANCATQQVAPETIKVNSERALKRLCRADAGREPTVRRTSAFQCIYKPYDVGTHGRIGSLCDW